MKNLYEMFAELYQLDTKLPVYYSNPNAKLGQPRLGDAGFDIYAPESFTLDAGKTEVNLPFKAEFFKPLLDGAETSEMIVSTLALSGFSCKIVKTGIHVAIPQGFIGMIKDRSSMGVKTTKVFAGVIDDSYRGEIGVVLVNFTDKPMTFEAGSKIAQMLIIPVVTPTIDVVGSVEALGSTERGSGGFGSTGS